MVYMRCSFFVPLLFWFLLPFHSFSPSKILSINSDSYFGVGSMKFRIFHRFLWIFIFHSDECLFFFFFFFALHRLQRFLGFRCFVSKIWVISSHLLRIFNFSSRLLVTIYKECVLLHPHSHCWQINEKFTYFNWLLHLFACFIRINSGFAF